MQNRVTPPVPGMDRAAGFAGRFFVANLLAIKRSG